MSKPYGPWMSLDSASVNPGAPAAAGLTWNGGWVSSLYDEPFASDTVWAYANARHNILAVPYCGSRNFSEDSASFRIRASHPGSEKAFAIVPVEGRLMQPGTLRCWFYANTTSESAANTVELKAALISEGRDGVELCSASTTVCATAADWYSVDIAVPGSDGAAGGSGIGGGMGSTARGAPFLALYALVNASAANYVTIESVCAYQPVPSDTPTHLALDTAGAVFGSDDIPRSTAKAHKMQQELQSVFGNRLQRSNVLSHWFTTPYAALTAGYPADDGNLGKYRLVKRAGCSTMYAYACVGELSGTGDSQLKFTLTTSSETTATVTSITATSCAHWVGAAFSFSTADAMLEKELTLNLCGRRQASGDASVLMVSGVCVTEAAISPTSISYTVPNLGIRDRNSRAYSSIIMASQQSEECSVLTHLWKRSPAIALSDWRSGLATGYQNQVLCNVETASKHDPQAPSYNAASSIVARALVFPSVGCSRLRITLGLQRVHAGGPMSPANLVPLYVWAQLSTSTVLATYDWNGPVKYASVVDGSFEETWLESTGEGEFSLETPVTGSARKYTTFETLPPYMGYRQVHRLTCLTPPITSTYTLTPSSTISAASLAQPLQLWVMAWSDAAATEHLAPIFLTADEVSLGADEID